MLKRSRDSGESDSRAKQQLNSLIFLSNLIKSLINNIPQQSDRSLGIIFIIFMMYLYFIYI